MSSFQTFIRRLRQAGFRRILRKLKSLLKSPIRGLNRSRRVYTAEVYAAEVPVLELIEGMPESNGAGYYTKAAIRVGIISDEFMYNYYRDAVELVHVTPANHQAVLSDGDLDLVLYVSCWKGMNGNEWRGEALQNTLIPSIFEQAREAGIPTVFQTIEDPTNFDRFLPIAKAADHVFTSAVECVDEYRAQLDHNRIQALHYGVNPLIHNPIGINHKHSITDRYDVSTAFFAGSWTDRYPDRAADIKMIFDGVLAAGKPLLVADRNVDVRMPGYIYPRRYHPYLMPAIEHEALQKVHKLFDFNININTVQDSLTMCAMRTVELQALGCLQLSNYALAISHGHPGIFIINTPDEIGQIMNSYDRVAHYRMQVDSIRNVMSTDTVYDRLNTIFDSIGKEAPFSQRMIDVVCDEISPRVQAMFDAQSIEGKRLLTIEAWLSLPESTRGHFVTMFTEAHTYDEYYLQDLANAFKYTSSDYVTKDASVEGVEYDFVSGTADLSLTLVKSSLLTREALETGSLDGEGFKLDPFEVDEAPHSPQAEAILSVVVPVYNNGRYLEGRCFRSLLRSSIFDRMEIVLVDDGSSDSETITVLDRLERRYENVRVFRFDDGGSGSAARPRNKGIEIATTPYVTYLDPDNEALNDGYAELLALIERSGADLAFGAILKVTGRTPRKLGYVFGDQSVTDPRALLLEQKMRVSSIQALIARRSLIVENGIENPVGSVGQDSLFFQELLLNARSAEYLDLPIHLYYAERQDSTVNVIGPRFFERSLILEREQARRFREYGVLEDYKAMRLDHFIESWYIDKLRMVAPEDFDTSLELLEDIVQGYGKELSDYEVAIEGVRAVLR